MSNPKPLVQNKQALSEVQQLYDKFKKICNDLPVDRGVILATMTQFIANIYRELNLPEEDIKRWIVLCNINLKNLSDLYESEKHE